MIPPREEKMIDDQYSDLTAAIMNKITLEFNYINKSLDLKYKQPPFISPVKFRDSILESLKISKGLLKHQMSCGLVKS